MERVTVQGKTLAGPGENLFAELAQPGAPAGGDQDWHREMGGKKAMPRRLGGRETAYMLLSFPLVFILAAAVRRRAVVYDHGQRWRRGPVDPATPPRLLVRDAHARRRRARSFVLNAGDLIVACGLLLLCRWRKGAAWRRWRTSPPPRTTCSASSTPPNPPSRARDRGRRRATRAGRRRPRRSRRQEIESHLMQVPWLRSRTRPGPFGRGGQAGL